MRGRMLRSGTVQQPDTAFCVQMAQVRAAQAAALAWVPGTSSTRLGNSQGTTSVSIFAGSQETFSRREVRYNIPATTLNH